MRTDEALAQIKTVVGPRGWITDPAEIEPHLVETGRPYRGEPAVEIALMPRVKRAPDPDNIMNPAGSSALPSSQ